MKSARGMKSAAIALLSVGIASCSDQFPSTLTAAQIEGSSLDCPFSQPIPVDASVMDIEDGVVISFSGPASAVDLIRANVHTMKYVNGSQGNPFSVCACANDAPQYGLAIPAYANAVAEPLGGESHPPQSLGAGARSTQPWSPVAADASIDETPLGALLVLRPKDPSQLQSLRDAVRANVGAMQTACTRPL